MTLSSGDAFSKLGLYPENYDKGLNGAYTNKYASDGAFDFTLIFINNKAVLMSKIYAGERRVTRVGGHYLAGSVGTQGAAEFWLDSRGLYHREDGPAYIYTDDYPERLGTPDALESVETWYWHGREGLFNFPDDVLAKIGDTVI